LAILTPLAAVTNVVGVPGSEEEDEGELEFPPHAYRLAVVRVSSPIHTMLLFETLLIATPKDQ
jgi:hypothetical protein